MKVCRTCKEEKHLIAFSLDNKAKDKHNSECKICRSKRYFSGKAIEDKKEQQNEIWYKNMELIFVPLVLSYVAFLVITEIFK